MAEQSEAAQLDHLVSTSRGTPFDRVRSSTMQLFIDSALRGTEGQDISVQKPIREEGSEQIQ